MQPTYRGNLRINSAPVLWRTALQAEYQVWDYPGTPTPSVYQVTYGTALQAAECHVQHLSYEEANHITRTPSALRCLEGTTLSNRGQRPRYR